MSVLASDNFNRANETPLSGSGSWTSVTGSPGTFDLVSNAATPHSFTPDAEMYYSAIGWPDDQFSRAKISVTGVVGGGSGMGLIIRASTSARTLYRLIMDHAGANNVDVAKLVAGAYTSIARFTQVWSDGDTWEFRATGSILQVFLNNVQVGTDQIDAGITSGSAGIAYSSSESAGLIDDWQGGDLVVPSVIIGAAQQPVVWATRIRS